MPLIHYLLTFDVRGRELIGQEAFADKDAEAASARYAELENQYRGNDEIEVVLVSSDSIDTIRQTHGNYFRRAVDDRLAELVDA